MGLEQVRAFTYKISHNVGFTSSVVPTLDIGQIYNGFYITMSEEEGSFDSESTDNEFAQSDDDEYNAPTPPRQEAEIHPDLEMALTESRVSLKHDLGIEVIGEKEEKTLKRIKMEQDAARADEQSANDAEFAAFLASVEESTLTEPTVAEVSHFGTPLWVEKPKGIDMDLIQLYGNDRGAAEAAGKGPEYMSQRQTVLDSLSGRGGFSLASKLRAGGAFLTQAKTYKDFVALGGKSPADKRRYIEASKRLNSHRSCIINDLSAPTEIDVATYGKPTWVSSEGLSLKFLQKYDDDAHAGRKDEGEAWSEDFRGVMESLSKSHPSAKSFVLASKLSAEHSILSRFKDFEELSNKSTELLLSISFIESAKELIDDGIVIINDLEMTKQPTEAEIAWQQMLDDM